MSSVATESSARGGRQSPDGNELLPTPADPIAKVSDAELIQRFVTDRDESAFRVIVERYTSLVLSVALRTVHDRQAAEDVLQATFLVLVEKADSLDDPSGLAAWLHGVAQRIARRLVDKRHRHREQPHREENVTMIPDATTDPFERVSETRDHDVLGEELQRLLAKYRTPLVLRYLEDLTNEQVAERLGMKVSTVEGRLKRGKKELRRRLARRGVTLGAAMLVWNMTQQSLAAAPVADMAAHIATTALAWQSPTPAIAPPTEPAITLAQKEILSMSTLKLTTAGTLVGTTLLATGLIVAMTNADDHRSATAATASAAGTHIDTSVDAKADGVQTDVSVVPSPTQKSQKDRAIKVFQLRNADAESAVSMLSELFSADGEDFSDPNRPRPALTYDQRQNQVIAAADVDQLELIEAILLRLDQPGESKGSASPPVTVDQTATEPPVVEAFPLQFVEVTEIVKLFNELNLGSSTEMGLLGQSGIDPVWPRLVADARKNMIVARGTEQQMAVIGNFIQVLDTPQSNDARAEHGKASRFDMTKRSPAEEHLRQALKSPTVPAFDEMSLDKVLFILAEQHDFQYFIDRQALEDVGISISDQPTTLNLQNSPTRRDDVTVESVLDLTFRQVNSGAREFGDNDLAYFIRDGLLIVTTHEVAEQTMDVRTYDLRPFNAETILIRDGAVVEAIQTMTGEGAWADQGGRGSLVQGVSTLTIRQSPLVHREIEALLEQLLHAAEQSSESTSY